MPPTPLRNFSQTIPDTEVPQNPRTPANDAVFSTFRKKMDTLSPKELEGRVEALTWLMKPGNGASEEAVAKFKEELTMLQEIQKEMEEATA